jgi:hypothetical protein
MNKYTHQTAPTQFVEANGIRFAYRRFGKAAGVPLVFNQAPGARWSSGSYARRGILLRTEKVKRAHIGIHQTAT